MIPEEDRGPAWLRDYGGSIEADIQRMEQFAAELEAEVRKNYVPHMKELQGDMMVEMPGPPADFPELVSFLQRHQEVQQETSNGVWNIGNKTGGMATAAKLVSENYSNSDAFSHARVRDVEQALDQTGVTNTGTSAAHTDQGSTGAPQTPGSSTDHSGAS
ncbi:hypothetical protein [Plantactinospora sp. CA-290183]|uniref:hypothetical protein n=1 Tax=Plantactinospora sp. CA-290183 TaxID=3240006 RepID=UPI003D94E175